MLCWHVAVFVQSSVSETYSYNCIQILQLDVQSVISQFPLDSGVDASDMLRWNAPCEIAFFH